MITNIVPLNNQLALKKQVAMPKSQTQHSKATTSNALQKQLTFMGTINHPVVDAGALTLEKYRRNMDNVHLNGASILFSENAKNKNGDFKTKIILLDNPFPFAEGIKKIKETILTSPYDLSGNRHGIKVHSYFYPREYEYLSQVVAKDKKIKDIQIKGIMGQGTYSSAFLTKDNDIFKLSWAPLFPASEHMIDGEIPIKERFVIESPREPLYGVIEPLAENTILKPISRQEYNDIWKKFDARIKQKDPKYEFSEDDFEYDSPFHQSQIGFISETPYFLDHQIVRGRPLIGE